MPFIYCMLVLMFSSCSHTSNPLPKIHVTKNDFGNANPYARVAAIPVPAGFYRIHADSGSFAGWLRQLPLKKSKTVCLFNGHPKANQTAQFAVIDISTGNKDLQQCADAVMRLRAEYLYSKQQWSAIDFADNNHTHYRLPAGANRSLFNQYLEKVFSYCGTASLDKQLNPVADFKEIEAGDVLIKAGAPGHAMQVLDIAINKEGKKLYLLAQSYMPAQDMHVVVNPANSGYSPWYEADDQAKIATPEWTFIKPCLKKWPTDW